MFFCQSNFALLQIQIWKTFVHDTQTNKPSIIKNGNLS